MSSAPKFRPGEEVTYIPNKNAEPVLLTYIETMKNGINRFFSSQFPSLEFHIVHGHESIKPYEEKYEEEIQEKYIAFKGGEEKKQHAYEIFLARRGQNAK